MEGIRVNTIRGGREGWGRGLGGGEGEREEGLCGEGRRGDGVSAPMLPILVPLLARCISGWAW